MNMIILGIETSCDETSAAIVENGSLLSNSVASQLEHTQFGGVVPELASRAHQKLIVPIVEDALTKAGISRSEISAVAAVNAPGLIGALLVGLSFAKGLSLSLNCPFIGINHLEGHIFSNLIEDPKPDYPFINLTVSGGHTQLILAKESLHYQMLGNTLDDAAGEAFDKVAKMLGLGYPGGPLIDKFASEGNPASIPFPRPYLESDSLQFSFSGLKTAVLYHLKATGYKQPDQPGKFSDEQRRAVANICASFQASVVDVLVMKMMAAAKRFHVRHLTIAGGVAANSELRRRLSQAAERNGCKLFLPKKEFCTDNAAMIAMAGYARIRAGMTSPLSLGAFATLSLSEA
jgi:N6-L-threonylcarbamoyladenine synthase